MSTINVDARTVLVDALKVNLEDFELSNLILQNKRALKAIYEVNALKSEMLEFAKDPNIGLQMLGPPPPYPTLDGLDDEKAAEKKQEYYELKKMYEQQKESLSMNVPHSDFILIENYLEKFRKTLVGTSAIKGKRFFALTKQVTEEENGIMSFFKKNSAQS